MQEDGHLYARTSLALEDHDTFTSRRTDAYVEWGATSDWTLSAKYEQVDFDTSSVFDSSGYRVYARRRIWAANGWSATTGAGLLEGAAIGGFQGCESLGGEIGAGLGHSGQLGSRDYFIGANISHREHRDSCQTNRTELVIGLLNPDGFNVTHQYWLERGDNGESDKLELMVSRQIMDFEIGVAARREFSGAFDETALVFSLAYRR